MKGSGRVFTLKCALQSADTSVCQDMSPRHCVGYRPPQTSRAGTAIGTVRWTETTESRVPAFLPSFLVYFAQPAAVFQIVQDHTHLLRTSLAQSRNGRRIYPAIPHHRPQNALGNRAVFQAFHGLPEARTVDPLRMMRKEQRHVQHHPQAHARGSGGVRVILDLGFFRP